MRLLGYVRRASRVPVVRAFFNRNAGRTAKANIREASTDYVKLTVLPSGSSLRSSIVSHLNLLLGTGKLREFTGE